MSSLSPPEMISNRTTTTCTRNMYRTYPHHVAYQPSPRERNRYFIVELRSLGDPFTKDYVETLISDYVNNTEYRDVPQSGHVASLNFRYWDDAADAVVSIWERRLDGAHDLVPSLIENDYCHMDQLHDRIQRLFSAQIWTLLEGALVQKLKKEMDDDVVRVSGSLRRHNGNDIEVFHKLWTEKKGLEAKKGIIEKRIGEFQGAMKCVLYHLEGGGNDMSLGFDFFSFGKTFEWIRLHHLIKRECRRLHDGFPIYSFRTEILRKVMSEQVMVLVGETGSGKSTQLVQYLADSRVAANGSIICTQPRKLAAISLAHRVEEESSGCCREEKAVISCPTLASVEMYNSKVIFMTDHCLLQYYMKDNDLSKISCIIVDEAHERSLNTDLLLALLKKLLPRRPDLRLIIMSATADAVKLAEYFFNCGTFNVEGRNFPVDVCYESIASKPNSDSAVMGSYVSDVLRKVTEIHRTEEGGTILAFLTSQSEVEWACEKFTSFSAVAVPLHGKLLHSDQLRAFHDYPGKRKVIFSTNVAETSLTIPGVKYVVDSGMMKESSYEPGTGMNVLKVCRISQSSAKQRAGRAGRTESGKCYRLYSQHDYESMISHQEPEICRVHLGVAVLRIIALGVKDVQSFDFIDAPSVAAIDLAIRNLIQLGAVAVENDKMELTANGSKLLKLGIEPRLGKLILHCIEKNMGREGLILAAVMANSSSIFCRVGSENEKIKSDCLKVRFCHRDGDLFTLLSVYKEWESIPENRRNNWCWVNSINSKTMRKCRDTVSEWETCLRNELYLIVPNFWCWNPQISTVYNTCLKNCILSSLPENVAMYSGNDRLGYEVALTGKLVQLHPSSSLLNFGQRPSWVVFSEILSASNQYLVCVTAFDYEYLTTLSPPPLFDTSRMEERRLQLRVLGCFGSTLLKRFCGKSNCYLLNLVSRLRTACVDEWIGIEVNVDLNELLLYASSQDMENVNQVVSSVLDYEKKWLQNECMEKCLYNGGAGRFPSFALFGAGARIKHLELEKRCFSVDVFHSNVNAVDDKELILFLEDHSLGSICIVQKFTSIAHAGEENKKWGRVTFLTPGAAEKAAELNPVEFGGGQLKIIPSRSSLSSDHHMSSCALTARVSWPRRMSKGFGFVKCSKQDVAKILDDIANIEIEGNYVRSQTSLRDEGSLMIGGLDKNLSETEILEALRASTNRELWDFFLVRGDPVNDLPCGAYEEAILREISPFMTKRSPHTNSVSVQVFAPNPKDAFMRAKIMFDGNMHLEAAEALEEIDGKVLPGCFQWQKIKSEHQFQSSLSCSKTVYYVIKEPLDSLLAKFRRRRGAKCRLEMKTSFCIVRISANGTKTVAELRRPLEELMHGSMIDDPNLTPPVLQILFSREGICLMKSIQRETGTYISFERHCLYIRIFGSPYKIPVAKQKLVQSLVTLYESKSLEIPLRGGNLPPDLMKKVVHRFGPDLKGLKEKFPGSSFSLSTRRHVISLCGDKEIKKNVEDIICHIAEASAPWTTQENEAACPICLCEVDDSYRLEDCGHTFCRLCLLEQCDSAIKSRDSFPLQCMREGCGAPILLCDLRTLLAGDKLEELFRSSLSSFVASSEGKFRFCPSPDCPSVYQVAGPDTPRKTFVCGACFVETCTSCHMESHRFISCEMYKEFKQDPDLSLKEWCKGKEHVKECPVCGYIIEKIDGCNHVECQCGNHICWVCLAYYGDSQGCYDHLRSVHGAIV